MTTPHSEDQGYEKKDINILLVAGTAAAVLLILIIVVIMLSDFFVAEKEKIIYEQTLGPESGLLLQLRAREDSILTTYKLLDTTKQIYRIPIDRAMELMVLEANR
jgi:hypothetical protein